MQANYSNNKISVSATLEVKLFKGNHTFLTESWISLQLNKNILNYDYAFTTEENGSYSMTLFFSKQKHKYKAMSFIAKFAKDRGLRYKFNIPQQKKQKKSQTNIDIFNLFNNVGQLKKPNEPFDIDLLNLDSFLVEKPNAKSEQKIQEHKNQSTIQNLTNLKRQNLSIDIFRRIGQQNATSQPPLQFYANQTIKVQVPPVFQFSQRKCEQGQITGLQRKICKVLSFNNPLQLQSSDQLKLSKNKSQSPAERRIQPHDQKIVELLKPKALLSTRVKLILNNPRLINAILQEQSQVSYSNILYSVSIEDQTHDTPNEFN